MQINVNGARLHCAVHQKPNAPWVMLAHGIATDMSIWVDVAAHLSTSFSVLCFDTRGHGGSQSVSSDLTFEILAADAVGIMDALKIPRVHFAGLSLGGMVGLSIALSHSDRLVSLACCDARASVPAASREAWVQRCAAVRDGGVESIVEQSMARWFAPGFRARQPARAAQLEMMIRRTSASGYLGCVAALLQLDYFSQLGQIVTPTLYLVGEYDQGAPPAVVRSMQEATPESHYVEIRDAGHLSCAEQPAAVAAALAHFFNDVQASEQPL